MPETQINSNWSRWIKGSIFEYFLANKGSNPLFLEGTKIDFTQSKWVEVSTNGPTFRLLQGGVFQIETEISLMCTLKLGTNIYDLTTMVGFFQNLIKPIPIKKYGKETGDDKNQIGCLVLRDDVPRPIDTLDWGRVKVPTDGIEIDVLQTGIEIYMTTQLPER